MPFWWSMSCLSANVMKGYPLNCTCVNKLGELLQEHTPPALSEFFTKTWVLLFEYRSFLYLHSNVLSLWLVVMKPPLIWSCVNTTHLKEWAWGNRHRNATWKCILACLIEVFTRILQCFPAFYDLFSSCFFTLILWICLHLKKNSTVHSQKHLSQIDALTLDT